MDKKQIQKNIYDLEYAKSLNMQSTFITIIATFAIGYFLGPFPPEAKEQVLVFVLLVFFAVLFIYSKELNSLKKKISLL